MLLDHTQARMQISDPCSPLLLPEGAGALDHTAGSASAGRLAELLSLLGPFGASGLSGPYSSHAELYPQWTSTLDLDGRSPRGAWDGFLWGRMTLSGSTEESAPCGASLDSGSRRQAGPLLLRSPCREWGVSADGHRVSFWGDEMS